MNKIISRFILKFFKYNLILCNLISRSNINDFYIINSAFYKKYDTLNNNIKSIWLNSYESWQSIFNDMETDLNPIHNISYNYWIRGYAANKVYSQSNNKNLFFFF